LHEQIAGEAVWEAAPSLLNRKFEQSGEKKYTIKAPHLGVFFLDEQKFSHSLSTKSFYSSGLIYIHFHHE